MGANCFENEDNKILNIYESDNKKDDKENNNKINSFY